MQSKPTIIIDNRIFDNARTLQSRTTLTDRALYKAVNERGMPPPIKIGGQRYYERAAVDQWLLSQRASPSQRIKSKPDTENVSLQIELP